MANPQKPIISFVIDAHTKEALQRLAADDQRSLSQYISILLKDHVAAKKVESGKPAGKRK
jgi:hypothetical protein